MSGSFNPEREVALRPASAEDQPAIRRLVRAARLFPLALRWRRFLVAETDDQIVGVGQIRPHADGSRELASLAVKPGFQRRGIGSRLVEALLAREQGPVFLFCRRGLRGYYRRFGFRVVRPDDLPWQLAFLFRVGRASLSALARLGGPRWIILAMRRQPGELHPAQPGLNHRNGGG